MKNEIPKTKYVKRPHSNVCLFCRVGYSSSCNDLFGKLFEVTDSLVGESHWHTVVVCPKCIRKKVAATKKKMDEMLAEVDAHESKKRMKRIDLPKRALEEECDDDYEDCFNGD